MNIKYEISKEQLEEIKKARKNTNNKKEDKRLHAVELRALGYSNEEIVEILLQVHHQAAVQVHQVAEVEEEVQLLQQQ